MVYHCLCEEVFFVKRDYAIVHIAFDLTDG